MAARHNPPLIAARSFESAARHLSFLQAAHELNVTPTAVSHQVKRLEEYLGQQLFVRMNRAVQLTEAGAALAATLRELFVQLEAALDPELHLSQSTITISAMPSLAAKWLAQRLPGFEAAHPQWRIRLDADDKLVDFKSGTVDLALRYGAGKWKGVHVRRWMEADLIPVCSPALLKKTPLDKLADLRHHTLVHYEAGMLVGGPPHWKDWVREKKVRHVDVKRGPMFESVYMALEAAQAGHGVVLAARPLVDLDLAQGRLVQPLDAEMANPFAFWIVCPRKRLQEEKIKTLVNWLMAQAPG